MLQQHSGSGKGFYFIPEIDEEVLVGFEGSNAQNPYVLGTQYNGSQSSGYADGQNNVKAIHAHSGTKIILNTELYKSYSYKKYQNHFKVYFINEDAKGLYGIGRSIDKADDFRTILVYNIGFADSTVAHETLHSMGLYHTFDNNSDFTFEIFKTDNIMDYSDTATPAIPVISLYHWQWSKLWDRATKDI